MTCTRFLMMMPTILVATAFATPHMGAQVLECVQPAQEKAGEPCPVTVRGTPAWEPIVVRVERNGEPAEDVRVKFEASRGTIDTEVRSGANGEARAIWSGSVGATPVEVTAEATVGGQTTTLQILLKAAPASSSLTVRMREDEKGDGQSWYEERQLKDSLFVMIEGAANEAQCRGAQVAFRAIGGSTSPDTARGMWWGSRCMAAARWRLGAGVGEQHVRAQLVGSTTPGVQFHGFARARPRLTTGLALTNPSAFDQLVSSADTVTVTRETEDSTVVTKRVTTRTSTKEVNSEWPITPVIGLDWPIIPQLHRLRLSAAASLRNPDRDWFFGVSLLQIPFGLQHEASGVSLHGVAHLSRRVEVQNPDECNAGQDCKTDDDLNFVGVGVMFIVDGTALLGNLATIFGIK